MTDRQKQARAYRRGLDRKTAAVIDAASIADLCRFAWAFFDRAARLAPRTVGKREISKNIVYFARREVFQRIANYEKLT
jgi:hypothetical protein